MCIRDSWLSVAIFENGNSYSFSRVQTICPSCFADMLFSGHEACTFMHPKYRTPSIAINAHQLCSSTYHLRKLFLQMKTYFTSFHSPNTEKPFSDTSPRINLTAMIPPARHVIKKKSFYRIYPQNTRN